MKIISIYFIFLFASLQLLSQAPSEKQWDYRFGGDEYEDMNRMHEFASGEIILFGTSSSDAGGDKSQDAYEAFPGVNSGDFWLVKLNNVGEKIWDYRYGGTQGEIGIDFLELADGSMILAGVSSSGIGGEKSQACWGYYDYWMIKVDPDGNKLWDKRFGSNSADYFREIIQTNDGGFVLGGFTEGGISGDKTEDAWDVGSYEYDYWIVKTDANGNKLWDKRYGGTGYDQMDGLVELADGSLMIGGYSSSIADGDKTAPPAGLGDYWIVKTDANGNYILDKKYGGNLEEICFDMLVDNANNILIGGNSRSDNGGDKTEDAYSDPFYGNTSDYWIVKIDADGNKLWDHRYGGVNFEDEFGNIIQTDDGGYLFTGNSYSPISGEKTENNLGEEQMWSVKTDINGVVEWDKTLFNNGHDEIGLGMQLNDGCYLFGNQTFSSIAGYKTQNTYAFLTNDFWIVKFCDSVAVMPVASMLNQPDTICAGECIVFESSSTDATNYEWICEGGTPAISTDPSPTICYNASGIYSVTLIVSSDIGSDTLIQNSFITVNASPQPIDLQEEEIICNGESIVLSTGQPNTIWNTGETGSELTVNAAGIYWASVSNDCGSVSDTVLVIEQDCNCSLVKPNAFSPNGDGQNDVFHLFSDCEIEINYFRIYNRWGQMLFETNGITVGWDGTCQNIEQPIGTYVYVVGYNNLNGEQIEKGDITLLR